MRLNHLQPWRQGVATVLAATVCLGLGAGGAYANSPGPEWKLINTETVRVFQPGGAPPADGTPATPGAAKALQDAAEGKVGSEWKLIDEKTVRFFQAGSATPKDGVPATEAQRSELLKPAESQWKLVGDESIRYFVAGPTPPDGLKPSDRPAADPFKESGWQLSRTDKVKFFAAFPTGLENPIPEKPANPAPEVKLGAINQYLDQARLEFVGAIRRERQGLLIRNFQNQIKRIPRTQTETTIFRAYDLEDYVASEPRTFKISHGGYTEVVPYTAQVKNYRWVLEETNRTSRELPYAEYVADLGEKELASDRASEIAALAAAKGDRPSSFSGDSGSGGKPALSAGKMRETLGANEVKVSVIPKSPEEIEKARQDAEKEAQRQLEAEFKAQAKAEEDRKKAAEEAAKAQQAAEEARRQAEEAKDPDKGETPKAPEPPKPLAIGGVLGNWVSTGGKSGMTIARNGNSNTMRVESKIVMGDHTFEKTYPSVPFGTNWEVDLGKDRLGQRYTLVGEFNAAGTEMTIKVVKDGILRDGTVIQGKFTKQP